MSEGPRPRQRSRGRTPLALVAVVVSELASEPLDGSVSAQQPTILNCAHLSTHGSTSTLTRRTSSNATRPPARRGPPRPLIHAARTNSRKSTTPSELTCAMAGSSSCFCSSLPCGRQARQGARGARNLGGSAP